METRLPMSAIQNVFATCPKLDFFKNAHIPLFILQYKLTFFLCIYIYIYIYMYIYIYIFCCQDILKKLLIFWIL